MRYWGRYRSGAGREAVIASMMARISEDTGFGVGTDAAWGWMAGGVGRGAGCVDGAVGGTVENERSVSDEGRRWVGRTGGGWTQRSCS